MTRIPYRREPGKITVARHNCQADYIRYDPKMGDVRGGESVYT